MEFDEDFVWDIGGRGGIGGRLYRKSHLDKCFFQGFHGGDGGIVYQPIIGYFKFYKSASESGNDSICPSLRRPMYLNFKS